MTRRRSVHCNVRASYRRQCSTAKYLKNIIEADHGVLKRLIRPVRGFQSMRTAYATIEGFEIMRMIHRGHCVLRQPTIAGEIQFIDKLFRLST
jgi:transposase, IS6 family